MAGRVAAVVQVVARSLCLRFGSCSPHPGGQRFERDSLTPRGPIRGSLRLRSWARLPGRRRRVSDIDLALRLAPGFAPADVAEQWTANMYRDHAAVDHCRP